jgi:uncharacterized lipoprotein YddW (UPF0748 family)
MTNTYRACSPAGKAAFGDDTFEADYSPAEEQDWLNGGVLELVPRTYRVLSDNYAAPVPQGETFEAVYLREHEEALVAGHHLIRIEDEPQPEPESEVDTQVSNDEAKPEEYDKGGELAKPTAKKAASAKKK